MPHRTLPQHPDIGQLKRQAKELKRAAGEGDPAALARFRRLPAYAGWSVETLRDEPLALHDAQSVLAREHGFPSWKALAEHVEEAGLRDDDIPAAFVEAATDGRTDRARRLLERHRQLPAASFHAALVMGDAPRVLARLAEQPELATQAGGPRGWQPLHYVRADAGWRGPARRGSRSACCCMADCSISASCSAAGSTIICARGWRRSS